jgi:hypothetical protein
MSNNVEGFVPLHIYIIKSYLKKVPSVLIPDTIIYKFDEPRTWFFIGKKRQLLQKKNKEKLNNEYILRSFLKRVSESGVVAVFFYKYMEEQSAETKVIFHYFNAEEFSK